MFAVANLHPLPLDFFFSGLIPSAPTEQRAFSSPPRRLASINPEPLLIARYGFGKPNPAAGRRLVRVLRHPEPQRRLFLVAINRTRNKAVTLRFTAEELALFQSQFQKSGAKNQADFLLALLRDKPIIVVDELAPFLAELKRQGNNLNQITRALHEGSATEQGTQQILRECHALYRKLLALKLEE